MLSGPLVFIFYLGPLYSKFKKKSPAQLSPSTSYLNIIWSTTTPNGSFSFPLFSLSFFLFSSLLSFLFLSSSATSSLSSSPVLLYKAHFFVLKEWSFYTYGDQTLLTVDTQSVLKRLIWVCQEFGFLFLFLIIC